ncbi:MAG: helix-turn-helix domain-containing protein [Rhodospirillales bacterium]
MSRPIKATFVLLPDFSNTSLAIVTSAMSTANREFRKDSYEYQYVSLDGRRVEGSNGRLFDVDCALTSGGTFRSPGYVFVLGGVGKAIYDHRELLSWLRNRHRHGAHIVGISCGVHGLALSGLLDNRDASYYWQGIPEIQEQYPKVRFKRAVFVSDLSARISTCAGGTTTVDLITHLAVIDYGLDLANMILIELQQGVPRAGSDVLNGVVLGGRTSRKTVISEAYRMIEEQSDRAISTAELADELGLSERQMRRLFLREIGLRPSQFIMATKLSQARKRIQFSTDPISSIAYDSGFSSPSYFSQCYRRIYGTTPSSDRNGAGQRERAL